MSPLSLVFVRRRRLLHESNARGAPRSAAALPVHASKIILARFDSFKKTLR